MVENNLQCLALVKIAGKNRFISKREEIFPNPQVVVNEILLRFHYKRIFYWKIPIISLYEIVTFFIAYRRIFLCCSAAFAKIHGWQHPYFTKLGNK